MMRPTRASGLAAALILGSIGALVPTTGAVADREWAPNAVLRTSGIEQRGVQQDTCWDGLCSASSGLSFPPPRRATAGAPARIRIAAPLRIRRVDLDGWRRVVTGIDSAHPRGPALDVRTRVAPVVRDGEVVARLVRFRLPDEKRRLYLELDVRWGPNRSTSYTFYLRLT